MRSYTTLDGTTYDLDALAAEELAHFELCWRLYRDGMSWAEFGPYVHGSKNPLVVANGGLVTRAVWDHPLFKVVYDLDDRLAVAQGRLKANESDDLRDPFAERTHA